MSPIQPTDQRRADTLVIGDEFLDPVTGERLRVFETRSASTLVEFRVSIDGRAVSFPPSTELATVPRNALATLMQEAATNRAELRQLRQELENL
jgi:hypothetical protein